MGIKALIFILVTVLAAVQYKLWVGEDSLAGLWRLENSVEAQNQDNQAMKQRNQRLAAEVEDLKTGLATVEDRARSELGMVHEEETYYQIVDR